MLSQLYINNIAVISEATIDFSAGLNVFTGETGAGKTILISAINAVLGGRTSKDIIRTGETKATVSAVFTYISDEICQRIESLGFIVHPFEGLLISREIDADGRGSCKINGRPANLSALREVSTLLISVHGQQDNYELLTIDHHIGYIDKFNVSLQLINDYRQAYDKYTSLCRQLDSLQMDENLKAQRLDILTYQINDIESANLVSGEEEELTSQRAIIKNSEKISDALALCMSVLSGDCEIPSLMQLMESLDDGLSDAAKFIPDFARMSEKAKEFVYELEDISENVRDQIENSEFDPRMLDKIENRLDLIHRLKKKYGSTIDEILEHMQRCQSELGDLEFADEKKAKLSVEIEHAKKELSELSDSLTSQRLDSASQFIKMVQDELEFLDMPQVRLSISHKKKDFSPNGCDDIEFFIAPNAGEEPKPLAKIASGGEMARTMLAIKNVLSNKDDIGTLIFDEVDTGVSGRAAQKIGQKLRQVSSNRQVICVTHLAQVASYADRHLYIFKEVKDERTFTRVSVLDRSGRVRELARITVGENITQISLSNADEMLKTVGN